MFDIWKSNNICDNNPKTIDESTSQRNNANNIEIYLGRLPANASQLSQRFKKEQNDNDNRFYQLIKLEAVNEVRAIDEIKMQDLVRNYLGSNDNDRNREGVTSGEEKKVPERDANDLNSQLKTEQETIKRASTQQDEGDEALNGAVASVVNDRQHYMKIAKSMDIDGYGPNEICDRLIAEKQKNPDLTDDELQSKVTEQLAWEIVPGPNPRRNWY